MRPDAGLALAFALSGTLVILAGIVLARSCDVIGEVSGFGRVRIGAVLLAGATSLPELTTDITAVRIGAPDIAVGDLFGSSMANMLILGLVAMFARRAKVLQAASPDQRRVGILALTLNALAAALLLSPVRFSVLGLGPEPVILVAVYLYGMRQLHHSAARAPARAGLTDPKGFRRAIGMFFAAAIAIFIAAPEFARAASRLADVTGLGDTFVGTALVGFATSLPELVASAAAVRAGAIDLAVGNLFGSNALNMLVFFPLDLVERGPLFGHVQQTHVVTGAIAAGMMVIALMTLSPAFRRNRFIAEASPALLLLGYFAGLWALFLWIT